MSDTSYSWKNVRYGSGRQASHSDSLTRWILIAVILAIVCHIVVLLAMKKMPIFFNTTDSDEVITQSVVVRNVLEREYIEPAKETQVTEISEPIETAKNLLEELEMLEEAPEDMEIDFSPTIEEPEMLVPMETPAIAGDADASAVDLTAGLEFTENIEDLGTTDNFLKPALGQITIDPGKQAADEFDPDKFNTELAKGAGGDNREGVMEGFTPLAEMTRLSQSDLENAKGMIGSDLLYDFNKAVLRDSAKNSLLKVVLIIDKNPKMKCWIEGHTDLIGSDEANAKLSLARAEAVKHWLVHSMKISEDRLFVRGLGQSQPFVLTGDQDAQAINRRVEIKMRKNSPPKYDGQQVRAIVKKPRIIKPLRNPNFPQSGNDPAIETIPHPVAPPKAIPVGESDPEMPVEPEVPRAIPVEDNPASGTTGPVPPKAIPVE
ncbi:MAG: outer membrane protein OmpA-like peptidoglycan-associated protein [Cryomorphaceae bacterium]|jgi:outer membrane protein OmpA-like peptidoglycan-associated protein